MALHLRYVIGERVIMDVILEPGQCLLLGASTSSRWDDGGASLLRWAGDCWEVPVEVEGVSFKVQCVDEHGAEFLLDNTTVESMPVGTSPSMRRLPGLLRGRIHLSSSGVVFFKSIEFVGRTGVIIHRATDSRAEIDTPAMKA